MPDVENKLNIYINPRTNATAVKKTNSTTYDVTSMLKMIPNIQEDLNTLSQMINQVLSLIQTSALNIEKKTSS